MYGYGESLGLVLCMAVFYWPVGMHGYAEGLSLVLCINLYYWPVGMYGYAEGLQGRIQDFQLGWAPVLNGYEPDK